MSPMCEDEDEDEDIDDEINNVKKDDDVGGELFVKNKSGLFSCPAILPYGHTVILSLSLCLPGALYIFPSV